MYKVIDTHGHYVFGIDDGAETLPMSLEMIKTAYDQGARHIFCTSHDSAHVLAYKRNFALLKEYAAAFGLDVTLHPGCEIYCDSVYLNMTIEQLENGDVLPMGNSRYVLLEFATWTTGEEIIDCISRIRKLTKFKPIIAHIERYRWLFDDPQILSTIKNMQIPVQINTYSLTEDDNEARKLFVRKLLQEELVTFIGSDAHGTTRRPVRLENGIKYIYENCDEEYAKDICYRNAERMLLS